MKYLIAGAGAIGAYIGARMAQAGGDEGLGDPADAVGARTIGLADGNAIALDVLDDAGRSNFS